MGNIKHTRYQQRTVSDWQILKDNRRQLQCHPAIKVRVKVLEPGVQSRWCDRCQTYRYFILEQVTDPRFQWGEGVLRLRWMTAEEAADHEAVIDDEDLALIMENWT